MWRSFMDALRTIFADKTASALLVSSVILYSFFYPSAYTGELATRVPVVVVDQDHTATSRNMINRLSAVQLADVVAELGQPSEALRWVRERRASAIVIVPPGFERHIRNGASGTVALYGNGTTLYSSSNALGGIASTLAAVGADAAVSQAMVRGAGVVPPLTLVQRPLFNTRAGYASAVVPGVTFLVLQQTMLMGLALLAATWRERTARLSMSPPGLFGAGLAFFVIGSANVLYYTGFVFWFQDYPRGQGTIGALLVAGALFVGATVALAMVLGSFFRIRERPLQLWVSTSVPIYFLSGLSWPLEATPGPLAWLAHLLPTTPGIRLMVGINQMGSSLYEQRWALANLAILVVLYGSIAVYRYRRIATRPR